MITHLRLSRNDALRSGPASLSVRRAQDPAPVDGLALRDAPASGLPPPTTERWNSASGRVGGERAHKNASGGRVPPGSTALFRGCLVLIFASLFVAVRAEQADAPSGPAQVYVQRAEKITGALGVTDAAKAARVRDLIARQYHALSLIHAVRDARLQTAKATAATDKAAAEVETKAARTAAEAAQDKLHAAYLAALAVELTPAQIDQVKDGMTYGVLPLTFGVYQKMLPDLTAEQKAQLLAWLTEAREHAMDASTSDEKHGWFGKYKGRINNYLSKAGYNMKEAEKNLKH